MSNAVPTVHTAYPYPLYKVLTYNSVEHSGEFLVAEHYEARHQVHVGSLRNQLTVVGNGNGNQLGLYACMLAPTPGKSRYPGDGGKVSRWLIMT